MLNPATRQRYGRRTRDCGSVPSTSFSPAPSAYRLATSCLALKYTLMLKMLYALPPKLARFNPAQLCTRRTPPSPLLSAPSPSSPFHSLSRSPPYRCPIGVVRLGGCAPRCFVHPSSTCTHGLLYGSRADPALIRRDADRPNPSGHYSSSDVPVASWPLFLLFLLLPPLLPPLLPQVPHYSPPAPFLLLHHWPLVPRL